MGALDASVMEALEDTQQVPRRVIAEAGTPEAVWNAWPGLDAVEMVPIEKWIHPMVRLVVIAPHPDDEILTCGGLMAMHARRGGRSALVAVTDGEASHGDIARSRAVKLAETRRAERTRGLAELGCESTDIYRLGLADGKVASHRESLESELAKIVQWGDIVVTTWRFDGHPDHEACGAAAATVCASARCRLFEAPVWMWHWSRPADPQVPWQRVLGLPLSSDVVSSKRRAVEAHASQLQPRGDAVAAVLGQTMLDRLARRTEYFFT